MILVHSFCLFFVFSLLDKKLHRGISRATDDNVNLVSRARSEIEMDFHTNGFRQHQQQQQQKEPNMTTEIETPDHTFTLPDISIYPEDFRKFLEKDLIECSTLSSLESAQRLNWWTDSGYCRKLWPLSTSGDGNCLLHAASLAMYGFHDRKLTLRTRLYSILSSGKYRDALWRRWRFHQTQLNKQAGFVYSENEWSREWEEIVALASPEPRHSLAQAKGVSRRRSVAMDRNSDSIDDTATYESLEEIHIFALAHVLRRTIIVVADTVLRDMNGEAMAPIPFGGVYLPFEIPAQECNRAPLLLTYDMAHFSALVSMESGSDDQLPALIPLIDIDNVLLPIQFCIDPGEDFDWHEYDGQEGNWALTDREHVALLKEYLNVIHATQLGASPEEEICDDLTDEEYDRRIGDAEFELVKNDEIQQTNGGSVSGQQHSTGTTAATANGKSKAAKQLQSVAKQFGSIGKSMSKKIKKNIGSITKIGSNSSGGGGSNGSGTTAPNASSQKSSSSSKKGSLSSGTSTQSFTRQRLLCAKLKAKRNDYQEEMVRNYLQCAEVRFLDAERSKGQQQRQLYESESNVPSDAFGGSYEDCSRKTCCINAGCQNYGTAKTSYMCHECFEKQKEQELCCALQEPPRYGTGNSKFYAQSDMQSHRTINRLPSVRRLNELDQTLYLSNSTFYNDKRPPAIEHLPNFRHGYSPTVAELDSSSVVRKLSSTKSITPPIDYDMSDDCDFYRPNSSSSQQQPPGTASVYSPGKTIIHKIIRHTVNLPPLVTASSASSSSASPPHSNYADETRNSYSPSSQLYPNESSRLISKSCQTIGCPFFGSALSNYYCSKCCQLRTAAASVTTMPSVSNQTKTQSKILTDV